MKKMLKPALVIAIFLLVNNIYARGGNGIDLTSGASDIASEIKKLYPYVIGSLFIVVVFMNLGHFTKEGGDWKKGLFNIILYVITISVITGLYEFVSSQSL